MLAETKVPEDAQADPAPRTGTRILAETRLPETADANAPAETQYAPPQTTAAPADPQAATRAAPETGTPAPAAMAAPAARGSEDLAIGAVIKNRFVVEGLLGRGGMGVVYRVKDLRKEETNDRNPYLAMKVLSDQYRRDPRMIMAMQREARKAQTLAHPNITTVYDFDRDDQLAFLTMEMLEGTPLDEFIRQHPEGIPRAQALGIIRGLCIGLAYAHNKNIIHSDFKPGNIFLTDDNRTKILDFGIARAAPVNPVDGSSEVTQFDAGVLGALTPAYASCEMLDGQEPNPADDVFALAIVSYQLLTGRHPFDSRTASEARELGLVPAPIRGLKRREWRAIAHGLAFDRSRRTGHAALFLRELEGSPKIRLALVAVIAALAVTSGYLVYEESRKVIENRPDVAFAALSSDVQDQFRTRLEEGRMLESFADYSSALQQYKSAYQLHPKNPEAVAALESLFTHLYQLSLDAPEATRLEVLAENLADVRTLDGYLADRPALKALAEKLNALQ
ncbi:MAG: serine/threonine-protein kinase [Pseudomonadota bacterium]